MQKKKMLAGIAVVLAVCCVAGGYVAIQNQRKVEAVNASITKELAKIENIEIMEGGSLPDLKSELDSEYISPGSVDVDIQNVDVTVPGTYNIVYNFKDVQGNNRTKTVTCTVNVDLKKHVQGIEDFTVNYGEALPESNITYDEYIDSVTRDDSEVDVMMPGSYPVTYAILGTDGRMETEECLATVLDTRPEPTPEPTAPPQPKEKTETGNVEVVQKDQTVKTSDDAPVIFYTALLMSVFVAAIIFRIKKIRKNPNIWD